MFAIVLGNIACKKTRTCSCDVTETSTSVSTPRTRNGITPAPTTNVNSTIGSEDVTYDKIKKSEMKRFKDCNSGSTTSTDTYTSSTSILTPTTILGITTSVSVVYTVDVTRTDVTSKDCKIK